MAPPHSRGAPPLGTFLGVGDDDEAVASHALDEQTFQVDVLLDEATDFCL